MSRTVYVHRFARRFLSRDVVIDLVYKFKEVLGEKVLLSMLLAEGIHIVGFSDGVQCGACEGMEDRIGGFGLLWWGEANFGVGVSIFFCIVVVRDGLWRGKVGVVGELGFVDKGHIGVSRVASFLQMYSSRGGCHEDLKADWAGGSVGKWDARVVPFHMSEEGVLAGVNVGAGWAKCGFSLSQGSGSGGFADRGKRSDGWVFQLHVFLEGPCTA